jgi:hypothetical protein
LGDTYIFIFIFKTEIIKFSCARLKQLTLWHVRSQLVKIFLVQKCHFQKNIIILNFKCREFHCFACTSLQNYDEANLPLCGDGAWTSSYLISRTTFSFWIRRRAICPIPDMSLAWLLAQYLGLTWKFMDLTFECPSWMWPDKESRISHGTHFLNSLSLWTVSYFAIILQPLEIIMSQESFFFFFYWQLHTFYIFT